MRHGNTVFGSPLEEPAFLQDDRQACGVKERRTRSTAAITLAGVLATGLTSAAVLYADSATRSHSAIQVLLGAGTQSRWIDPWILPEEEELAMSWDRYLGNLNSVIPGPAARKVRRLWKGLGEVAGDPPPIPRAGPTQQRSFILTWDQDGQHCEAEVFFDGHCEWFYSNRSTGNYEGSEGDLKQAIAATGEYLKRLVAAA